MASPGEEQEIQVQSFFENIDLSQFKEPQEPGVGVGQMNSAQEETQIQPEQEVFVQPFFKDINLYEIVTSRPLGYPGVWRLKRIFKYIRKYATDIELKVMPSHIKVIISNSSLIVKPWDLAFVYHPIFKIEIFWWKNSRDEIMTGIDITSEVFNDIKLLFYGFIEFEMNGDEVTLDITPKSKVWVIR